MTDPIWTKKPDPHNDKYWLYSARIPGEKEFLSIQFKTDYDAWVETLKAEMDELHETYNELHEMAQEWGRKLEAIKNAMTEPDPITLIQTIEEILKGGQSIGETET